jgi:hypothetical protein
MLSFTLPDVDGRPVLFSVMVAISLVCIWKATHRAVLFGALGLVLVIRVLVTLALR